MREVVSALVTDTKRQHQKTPPPLPKVDISPDLKSTHSLAMKRMRSDEPYSEPVIFSGLNDEADLFKATDLSCNG